jgi:hypothetical protein
MKTLVIGVKIINLGWVIGRCGITKQLAPYSLIKLISLTPIASGTDEGGKR